MAKSSFYFDDNKLVIDKQVWLDLVSHGSVVAFAGVVGAAEAAVKADGAFVIDGGEAGIFQRIDRMSELRTLVAEADQQRRDAKLKPRQS